ncbi:MAG: hypothetical protein M3Q71_10825 [Chloroflexota bacterium]|nr:hypothetical protein [Chloroflexota bacterium]
MTAAELLADLRDREILLELAGDQLRCRAAAGVLTPDLAATIKAHKLALIALLREEEAAIGWRVEAMREQVPAGGPIPFLVAVPNVAPAAGVCLSCGETFELVGYVQRCRLCAVAAGRVLLASREDIAQEAHVQAA